ncbi:MAG: cell surface protein SprA [Gemmatimonadota bacterium]
MVRALAFGACFLLLPCVAWGQADTTLPGWRATFRIPQQRLETPLPLRTPGVGSPLIPGLALQYWDSTMAMMLDSTRVAQAMALRMLSIYGTPLTDRSQPGGPRQGILGLPSKYADLEVDGQARLELRTDRIRNERCTPFALLDPASGCRGGFTPPRLDNQFNVLAGGVIGRRLHINVDYDSERDFQGAQNIQVYYQGLEDEIVQRLEVGTVTFQPPPSRFITAAVPANNFGVNATFQVGPFQFQTIAAQQKGSSVAERVFTVGDRISQPQDRQLRDLDFESGRFFWVLDPAIVSGYPALDILNLNPQTVSVNDLPKQQLRVYRYRAAQNQGGSNPSVGGINAIAISADGIQRQTARWELLVQNQDYYLDQSGLWFVLGSKLDLRDFLAVSYVTASGARVGTGPVRDTPTPPNQPPVDTLRLIVEPQVGADRVTFRHEMRQVYRIAGTDLDRNTLRVGLSVNQSERPLSGSASTYLALLGLSLPTDENVFDVSNRLFPRAQDLQSQAVVREAYVVLPHLQPFADPTRLTLPERSDSLYRTPLYLVLSQGPPAKFVFRLQYNASGTSDRSSLDLNAIQIREGSEQLTANGRVLARGVDYSIDYGTGRVTFLDPNVLFGSGTGTVVARFEERGFFAIAPTTMLGASTRYSMGDRGNINLIGIYQYEQTAFNRPPLGFEPEATLVAGINTDLHFRPNGITRLLNGITTGGATAPSRLDVTAELAMTKPDPNRAGAAYLEEFEGDAGIDISLRENLWQFGSRPQLPTGLDTEIPEFAAGFDSTWAVQLTWQNLVPGPGGQPIELRAQDIDPNIKILGTGSQRETLMFLTLHADTAGGIVDRTNRSHWSLPPRSFQPRWRSMSTALSTTGVDLSRNEYLEFWVFQDGRRLADSAGVRLVVDLGTVNEDALALVPESLTVVATQAGPDSTFTGRGYTGVGILDSERDISGIFDAATDDIGILSDRPDSIISGDFPVKKPALCLRELGRTVLVFPWGDLSSRCTNGNGLLDTEDLNADLQLNANGPAENVFRYVVTLGDAKYFVRDGVSGVDTAGRPFGWKLYRIPLRSPDAIIGSPNIRLVQHLRLTVASEPDNGGDDIVARFALARMKLVGSSWTRRADRPIKGLSGSLAETHGEIAVTVISTVNTELGYESPPGLSNQANRKDGGRDVQGQQINEKSLRVLGAGLLQGERAEAYFRFPSGPQDLLKYQQLRIWLRGHGLGWDNGELEAFFKLGSDDRNFYLYRTPVSTVSWVPEVAIDLETWRRLRGDIQTRFLQGLPPSGSVECGGDSTAYVACSGPYVVQVADPAINPPNLARVQEMAAGIFRVNQSSVIDTAELWVDDIRLTEPVSRMGTAMALNGRLSASDVADVQASFVRQDGAFQQIGQDPTYNTTSALLVSTAIRLERFIPKSLGVVAPLLVSYARNTVDPQLLSGTDLRASDLHNLRKPESWSATYALTLQRSRRGSGWITRGFVDPLTLSTSITTGSSQSELSKATAFSSSYQLSYNLLLTRTGPRLNLGGLVDKLPGFLRRSEGAEAIRTSRLSLVPSNIRFNSGLNKVQSDIISYQVQVQRPQDALLQPVQNLSHLWRNNAGMSWQPFGMLTMNGDLVSTRDLREYSDSTPLGRLAGQSRRSFLGMDVGVERDRQLATSLVLAPRLASWLRPRFNTTSSFVLSRSLTSRPIVRENGDSSGAFILPQTLNNSRARELGIAVDLARGLTKAFGDSSFLGRMARRVRPFDFSNRLTRNSTYDLASFDPGLGYQLALGGRESFLNQEGQSAIGVSETRTNSLGSGADLPFGLGFTLSYNRIATQRFQRVGTGLFTTDSRQKEWPVGSARFTRSFPKGFLSLFSTSVGFRRREGSTEQPSLNGQVARSATFSSSLTPDVQLGFRNGMVLQVSYSSQSQNSENNGNTTTSDQNDLTANFTYVFRAPGAISRLRKQVTASLFGVISSGVTCLRRATLTGCQNISDTKRTEFRGSLDTDLLKLVRGGLQFGYSLNDARHLNRRISQIFLAITLQLSLYAGDYR